MGNTIIEEIRVTGDRLINKVKQILKEGNVRRIAIKNDEGEVLLDVPLTIGIAGLGTSIFALGPIITAIGAFALFYNDYSIVVEREVKDENEVEAKVINIEDDEEGENDEEDENGNDDDDEEEPINF